MMLSAGTESVRLWGFEVLPEVIVYTAGVAKRLHTFPEIADAFTVADETSAKGPVYAGVEQVASVPLVVK